MNALFQLEVMLTLLGPFLTRGSGAPEPGIDAPLARDDAGRPIVPFSLVKGKVRDACRDLGVAEVRLRRWLGNISGDSSGSYDPERGLLRFSDLATADAGRTEDPIIERIEINSETGSVRGQMLAMIEAPFGYGQEVRFHGTIEFAADQTEAEEIRTALDRALRWVPAYGAMRSVGFGRTKAVKTTLRACPHRQTGKLPTTDRLPLQLTFDRPLCVVGRKHSRNHFECLQTIPGAALKGSCARLLLDRLGSAGLLVDETLPAPWNVLGKHFAALRFREARPTLAGRRSVEPPLSLVTSPTLPGQFFDVALEPGPRTIGRAAPAFDLDWKGDDAGNIRRAFGWPDLGTERRIRTAIDEDTGRARDEQLFSYGLVVPGKTNWLAEIALEEVPEADRTTVRQQLETLLEFGLPGIGKTRAVGSVEWLPAPVTWAWPEMDLNAREFHIVTLQTEALLTNPVTLDPADPASLTQAYKDFWREASDKSLELVRFFARQALHGGYLARRTRRTGYEPFLVTERGSTFVLKPTGNGDPIAALWRWQRSGLPVANWIAARYPGPVDRLWQRCPFLPHVGHGEVTVDLTCHTSNRPPAGD
jgi:hypothetical protein